MQIKMVATSKPYLLLLPTIFIITITYICVRSFTNNATTLGFSVELIHKDSPNSPFYDHSTTPSQKLYCALHHSKNLATHFLSKTKSLDDDNPESSLKYANAEYIMAYSLGTPSFQTYGVVDTGSDLTWLQCMPCFECYNQTIPMFDLYASSSTYRNYNCHSNECESVKAAVDDTYCDVVSNCAFKMKYLDRSAVSGSIVHDTLTLGTKNGGRVAFPKTLFGCAYKTVGNFVAESSGIVGLGRGRFSLISQMGSSIQRKFSYCLTPYFSSASSQLHFGQNAVVSGPGTLSTRLVSRDPYRYYFVNLEAVSVDDTRIDFAEGSQVEGNTVIDSGSRMSLFPEEFYFKLESEVENKIKLNRSEDPHKGFNLCYESEGIENVKAPILSFHFKGADVKLNPTNTFVVVSRNVVCFAFHPMEAEVGLVGNLAQINFMVGFDLQNSVVNFKPMDCTIL